MKTRIRPGRGTMLHVHDWLAEPCDGESADPARPGNAQPAGPGYAVPASYSCAVPASPGHAEPASYARARPAGPGYAVPAGDGRAGPADGRARPQAPAGPAAPARTATPATPAAPARPAAPAAPAGPAGTAVRAVIGDQLRVPVMWCEMGSCISFHADPAALGEADTRARAIGAGWRIDAFGRLACPRCQQANPGFRAPARSCRGTGTRPSPGPPGPVAPRCEAAVPRPCCERLSPGQPGGTGTGPRCRRCPGQARRPTG